MNMEEGNKRKSSGYVIGVDFDGTIVTNQYPWVGRPVPMAKEVINMLNENGHRCFLFTMRDVEELNDAIDYCESEGIPMVGYNKSPDQFSTSPKQYASLYIDDAAVGCPLYHKTGTLSRPYVNWYEVALRLHTCGLLTDSQLEELNLMKDVLYSNMI